MIKYIFGTILLTISLIYLISYFYLSENQPEIPPQPATKEITSSLKEKINDYLNQQDFNGVVLVAKQNEVIAFISKGERSLTDGIQNSKNTQFPIGSITKLFTAAAILKLEEMGKINLKETIEYYLPKDHPIWGGYAPEFIDYITINELLAHTSGLEDYTKLISYRKFRLDPHTTDELIQFFSDYPLKFMPGSQYDYSATNYVMLGAIIEEISKQTYAEFLKNEFFDPLKMHSTFFPQNDDISIAFGYDQFNSQTETPNFSLLYSDAGIISTAPDLFIFAKALFRGNLLLKEQLHEMETPRHETKNKALFTGYGLFIVDDKKKTPTYLSFGELEGYQSALSYEPETEFFTIILSNQIDGKAETLTKKLIELSKQASEEA